MFSVFFVFISATPFHNSVYKGYVRPAILYGSESWCLNEGMIGVLRRTERSMVRAMCGVQHKDRKELAI